MLPFLKWAGGKRWLVPLIIGAVPRHKVYYEPLVGSGALFFALAPERAVLSDSNAELMNCYHQIKRRCREVVMVLKHLKSSKKDYYLVRDRFNSDTDPVRRAANLIYLNKMSWNGLYRVNGDGMFNVPVRDLSVARPPKIFDAEQLQAASRVLRNAELLCGDFEASIAGATRGDFVYFDPPYITTHLNNGFVRYNSKLFGVGDELRLAAAATRLARRGVHVMVSNAAHPSIREQYDGHFLKREFVRLSLIAADPAHRRRFRELVASTFILT